MMQHATIPRWLLVGLFALTACTGGPEPPVAEPDRRTGAAQEGPGTPVVEFPERCPNPYGGWCKGRLDAGTHETTSFRAGLTYTVPRGWANLEDLDGQVLLLPPGRRVDGVDRGTADYLGVYQGAAVAAPDCSPEPMPGVGTNPAQVVRALAARPALAVTEPRRVSVGGLSGLVVDIRLVPGARAGCRVPGAGPIFPLVIGIGPADLEHSQAPGLRTRLYVLGYRDSNLVVEVSDVAADDRPFDHEPVIESFRIGR